MVSEWACRVAKRRERLPLPRAAEASGLVEGGSDQKLAAGMFAGGSMEYVPPPRQRRAVAIGKGDHVLRTFSGVSKASPGLSSSSR